MSVAVLGFIFYGAEGFRIFNNYKDASSKALPFALGSFCFITSIVFLIDAIIFILEDKKVLGVFFNKNPRNLFMKPSYFKIPCLVS